MPLTRFRSKARPLRLIGKLLVILAIAVALLVDGMVLENLRGWWSLHTYTKALSAAGNKLTPRELVREPSEAEMKNADALVKAGEALKTLAKECPLVALSPEMMKLKAPGFALVAFREQNPVVPVPLRGESPPPQTWKEVATELEQGRGWLDKVRTILREPIAEEVDYSKGGTGMGMGSPSLQILPWLSFDLLYRLHAGDLERAMDDIVALGALARCLETSRTLVPFSLAVTIRHYAVYAVWEAMQADGWTDRQLEAIQASLGGTDCLQTASAEMEMARALVPIWYDMLRQSASGRATLFRMQGFDIGRTILDDDYSPPEPSEFVIWMKSALWRFVWSHQDELHALRLHEPIVAEARKLAGNRAWASSPLRTWPKLPLPTGIDAWRFSCSVTIAQPDTASQLIGKAVKTEVERQLAIAAVGIKRFTLKNGRLPETLEALAPDFVSETPSDCMNGKPLRYRQESNGAFTLYSVGPDGIDDGGDASPGKNARRGGHIHNGRDIVWPAPAK